jgi:pyruvate/2-oxoglutarate/acetoin dehydrogenase E1 component
MTSGAVALQEALVQHAAREGGVLVGEGAGVAGRGARARGALVRTPLSESVAVGAAVGLALAGKLPVVELLDGAGVARAAEALADAGALVRRSEGAFAAPLVVLAPLSIDADIPALPAGVGLAVAATATDAAGLFAAALAGRGPVVLFVSDTALAARDAGTAAGLGVPVVVRAGAGVVILAEGEGVPLALGAGGEATVVDLRGCRDAAAIGKLVAPTGRVVVMAHERAGTLLAVLAGAFWRLESEPAFVHPREGAPALAAALSAALTP